MSWTTYFLDIHIFLACLMRYERLGGCPQHGLVKIIILNVDDLGECDRACLDR